MINAMELEGLLMGEEEELSLDDYIWSTGMEQLGEWWSNMDNIGDQSFPCRNQEEVSLQVVDEQPKDQDDHGGVIASNNSSRGSSDGDDGDDDDDGKRVKNSKNFKSEWNRRKRLNQQLFALRSLVPNITKMDKKSILADAQAYMRSIVEEIDKEMEMVKEVVPSTSIDDESSTSFHNHSSSLLAVVPTPNHQRRAAPPAIIEIRAEMLDEERLVLEIGSNKAMTSLGLAQRAVEMLGLEITCSSIGELNQDVMLSTTFIRVKKGGGNIEKIITRLRANARRLSLLLPCTCM
ncbi:hypothetical protein Scep_027468 [Stephania cephalantha]|uniref:BHLH domain-containing protein n=1 Tax=Stephania cephalantha TaxID=152367 RepID=A0AAP0E829_9MAGN